MTVTGFRSPLLTVIDTRTWQVSYRIDLQVADSFAVAAVPGGKKVYLTAHEEGALIEIDAESESVVRAGAGRGQSKGSLLLALR